MSHTYFAPVFTDHLVLQREKPIRIWGTCTPGTSLRIVLCGGNGPLLCEEEHILAERNLSSRGDHFRAELPALSAGGPYRLFLLEDGKIHQVLQDVMIGEVWLAGGQSNMEYELRNDADASDLFSAPRNHTDSHGPLKGSVASGESAAVSSWVSTGSDVPGALANAPSAGEPSLDAKVDSRFSQTGETVLSASPEKHISPLPQSTGVRFYQVLRKAYFDETFEIEERENRWMTEDDPKLGTWSAVAYHFAKELSLALHCCVGIIGCNWGGTSAAAWQDREGLLSHPETAVYWQEYQEILDNLSPEGYEKARREYALYQETWQPKIDKFYAEHPSGSWSDALAYAGPCLWPGPMGPKHEFRPCGLYETMLRRVTPYSLRGFLYYQGESDDHRPETYHTLLKSMVRAWRRDFEDERLSFLNVQLPMHQYESDPPSDSWAKIREAQLQLCREDPLSGLAVAIDLGEYNNIHPLHKKEVGHRLFLQSIAHVYQKLSLKDACGPMLRRAVYSREDASIRLEFDFADAGFDRERYLAVLSLAQGTGSSFLKVFEIAGPDEIYRCAEAVFESGDQTISLRIPREIAQPAFLHYLWTNYSLVPLFDRRGMPAAPFRTAL